jgi:hypothetical protein
MRGGFWETLTNAWEKTKQTASNAYGSVTGSSMNQVPTTTSTYVPSTTTTYGGKKKRTSRRKMRGGNVEDNMSLNNLAAHAAPFSGTTAQPHNWVGGKTRRHRRKRSYKNRRSHRRR